jgi:site-specific DNA recombinase
MAGGIGTMSDEVRWVATYERVSSDDQRERETIKTQTEMIDRYLGANPNLKVYRRYLDDGVSGTIPMGERPDGRLLIQDALARRFSQILVTRPDRLGRNEIDRLQVYALFESLGIELVGVCEPIGDAFIYGIHAIVDGHYRRRFLAQSAEGLNRAARDGRYTGGIRPVGYKVIGKKQHARLVPSEVPIWGDWTEAGLVRRIYYRLAIDGWSCRRIASDLNALGVPTAYQKDGRGVRGKRTQGLWRPGRIRNLVVNPVYKGKLQYGRRSNKPDREIIGADIEPLVSEEVWDAAQATLAANRIKPKNGKRTYLLRGLIVCGICGLHYCGCSNKGTPWYRCDGQLVERGPIEGRCPGKSIKGSELDPIVWDDIERWLRNPGDLIDELAAERNGTAAAAVAEADRTTLQTVLKNCSSQRDRMLDLYQRDVITRDELDTRLDGIAEQKKEVEERLQALEPKPLAHVNDLPAEDILDQIRGRLDEGLDDERRQEIASLLVRRITINTEFVDGRKRATALVEYKFPRVVSTCTGRDSWRPPA